jgi:hypothetical protein
MTDADPRRLQQQSDISRFFRCSQSSGHDQMTSQKNLFSRNSLATKILWPFVAFWGLLWPFVANVAFWGFLWCFT